MPEDRIEQLVALRAEYAGDFEFVARVDRAIELLRRVRQAPDGEARLAAMLECETYFFALMKRMGYGPPIQ